MALFLFITAWTFNFFNNNTHTKTKRNRKEVGAFSSEWLVALFRWKCWFLLAFKFCRIKNLKMSKNCRKRRKCKISQQSKNQHVPCKRKIQWAFSSFFLQLNKSDSFLLLCVLRVFFAFNWSGIECENLVFSELKSGVAFCWWG